jgi:hypothetical protein
MNESLALTRLLWVAPEDTLVGVSATKLADALQERLSCDVWLLCGGSALAYSIPGILVTRGESHDYDRYLEATRPLNTFVDTLIVSNADVLALEIPQAKFWVEMLLQPNEKEARYCCYVKSVLRQSLPFGFRASSTYHLSPQTRASLQCYLRDFIYRAGREPINGEILNLGETKMVPYQKATAEDSFAEFGFEILCSDYIPVTWPWIELILDMRKNLPKQHRLSIEFFNSAADSLVSSSAKLF